MPFNYQGLNQFHQVMERSWTDTCVTTIAFAFFKYHDVSLMRFDSNSSLCYDVSFVFLKRTFKMQQDGALTNCSKWPVEQFSLSHVLLRFSYLCMEQKLPETITLEQNWLGGVYPDTLWLSNVHHTNWLSYLPKHVMKWSWWNHIYFPVSYL